MYAGIERALKRALDGTTVIDNAKLSSAASPATVTSPYSRKTKAGVVIGLFAIHTSITERRHAELALRESQSFLALTGAAAGAGDWELTLITSKRTWSDETRRLHDVGPEFEPTIDNAFLFYSDRSRALIQHALADGMQYVAPSHLELDNFSPRPRVFGLSDGSCGIGERKSGSVGRSFPRHYREAPAYARARR